MCVQNKRHLNRKPNIWGHYKVDRMSSAHLHVVKEPHPELSKGCFTRPAHQCRPPRTRTVGSYLQETHPLLTHTQFHTRLTSTLYL